MAAVGTRRLSVGKALGGACALLVLLVSVGGTGALWSSAETLDGSQIHSGTLDLTVGAAGTQEQNYAFTGLARANMKPGDYAQAPLVLRNSGNVGLNYRLQSVTQSDSTLALNLTISGVVAEANCPASGSPVGATGYYNGSVAAAQAPAAPAMRSLDPGGFEVWCVRATVAPTAVSAASSTLTFGFTAESR